MNQVCWSQPSKGVIKRILFLLFIKYFLMETSKTLKQFIKIWKYIIKVDKDLLAEFCCDMWSSFWFCCWYLMWSLFQLDVYLNHVIKVKPDKSILTICTNDKYKVQRYIYSFVCFTQGCQVKWPLCISLSWNF